jgi:hypothetical protein
VTPDDFRWDVCLSFAGEQRPYVSKVAAALKKANVRVFYDDYEQVGLWGKNLYEHLDEVYQVQARFCVLFLSEQYAKKAWTNRERQSAQARALKENREYILPARFDDTEIKGLQDTVAYVDLRKMTPKQFANLIIKKLNESIIQQRVVHRFVGSGPIRHMRTIPQRTFELVMEFDEEFGPRQATAIAAAFPMPPFEDCEINTALPTVVIKGCVDAWAFREALDTVSEAASEVWHAVGPKDSMTVMIEGEKRFLKHGRAPVNLRVDPPLVLDLQICPTPNWRDEASLSLVDAALKRPGFRHAVDLWIPGNPDSVVAAYINETDFVICQYHEEREGLPIQLAFSSHYQDGKVLTDDHHYASGAVAVQEVESVYRRHLHDRLTQRPDVNIVFVSMNEQLEKWGSRLRLWPVTRRTNQ